MENITKTAMVTIAGRGREKGNWFGPQSLRQC